jgi:chromate reductase
VIGASTGAFGAVWAQRELKKVLGLMGARVLDAELPVAKADTRLADPDPELRAELASVLDGLMAAMPLVRVAA